MTNLKEYLAGTDPNDSESFLRIEAIGVGLVDLEQTVIEITWGSARNRLYTLERSDDRHVTPHDSLSLLSLARLPEITREARAALALRPRGPA